MTDPWYSLVEGELEYRQKVDKRNSKNLNYKDAPNNGNRVNGPNGKSFKSVQFSAITVAPEMEQLAAVAPHKKKGTKNASDYTRAANKQKRAYAPSSSYLPSEDGVLYSNINRDLLSRGCNENLQPEQIQKIRQLLEDHISKRTVFPEASTEGLVQDLYKKSQGISQREEKQESTTSFGSTITKLFDEKEKRKVVSSDKISKTDTSNSSTKTVTIHKEKGGEEAEDHTVKKPKLEGGFGLIKFHTSKSASKNTSSLIVTTVSTSPKLETALSVVSPKPDPLAILDKVDNKNNNKYRRRTKLIRNLSSLSDFGKSLVDSSEFIQCTFGVVFCDCKCTGCEFIHTGSSGSLVPGADCYYQSDDSKIEYCKYDPRWTTSEFESREIYDNVVGPILLFEESIKQHYHKKTTVPKNTEFKGHKMSLLFAIEMFESNNQILPLAVSIFFTSNLDRIELNGARTTNNGDSAKNDNTSQKLVVKPDPFCWSNNMDVLFTKTDEDIKKIFNVEDVTKIVRQIKSTDSVNRRVCCNKFNRSDAELFEFISCKNSSFLDASSGTIKLYNYEKDKNIMENILKLEPRKNNGEGGNKKINTPVRCKSTVDGITYDYSKSYLVGIIDSKIPSNLNIMIRSCFVLANITDRSGEKGTDKEKLVTTICNFNSYGDTGKNAESSTNSKYNFDVFGNQAQQKSSSSSSSSAINSSAIANQDTMTEEACFRPVMYHIDKLENLHATTMHGLMWNEIKMYKIWKYVRSYVIICPKSSNLENE